ncbi:MAG: hypothetical protein QM589_15785 [Thermomicrobiales bacterium]
MMTRRGVVLTGTAGLAGGILLGGVGRGAETVLAQDDATPEVQNVTTDGIGGGGIVPTGYGDATFALTAFALPGPDGGQSVFNGGFTLNDPAYTEEPILMVSQFFNQITAFSSARPNAREIFGWATVNDRGPYPYVLQVEDMGPIGSGQDTFNLVFGNDALPFIHTDAKKCDCGGFTYSLRGTVTQGDLVLFPLTTVNPGQ